MMKRMLLAAAGLATLATMAITAAPPAEAKVYVYGGVPYYGYAVAPHWRYYHGRGWYDPYAYSYVQPMKMTCGQARQAVKASGYYNVVTLDCSGRIYNFSALRKGKQRYVSVNARTGAVWQN
jgi:opacity protein-like surface antigen